MANCSDYYGGSWVLLVNLGRKQHIVAISCGNEIPAEKGAKLYSQETDPTQINWDVTEIDRLLADRSWVLCIKGNFRKSFQGKTFFSCRSFDVICKLFSLFLVLGLYINIVWLCIQAKSASKLYPGTILPIIFHPTPTFIS